MGFDYADENTSAEDILKQSVEEVDEEEEVGDGSLPEPDAEGRRMAESQEVSIAGNVRATLVKINLLETSSEEPFSICMLPCCLRSSGAAVQSRSPCPFIDASTFALAKSWWCLHTSSNSLRSSRS